MSTMKVLSIGRMPADAEASSVPQKVSLDDWSHDRIAGVWISLVFCLLLCTAVWTSHSCHFVATKRVGGTVRMKRMSQRENMCLRECGYVCLLWFGTSSISRGLAPWLTHENWHEDWHERPKRKRQPAKDVKDSHDPLIDPCLVRQLG